MIVYLVKGKKKEKRNRIELWQNDVKVRLKCHSLPVFAITVHMDIQYIYVQ